MRHWIAKFGLIKVLSKKSITFSIWRALVVPLQFVSSTGQAAVISISASIDNQIEYSDVNSLRINTQDDEIASWVARDLSGKFINGKWSLSDSLTPCYDHARQATKENDILYCVTIDILNYVLNDHSRIDKDTALQSIKKRADATLSALGRPNESEDAVSHAMLISNIVLDTIVAQQSHSEAGLTPQSPLAAPPASNPASDRTPPATASAPAAAPVPTGPELTKRPSGTHRQTKPERA